MRCWWSIRCSSTSPARRKATSRRLTGPAGRPWRPVGRVLLAAVVLTLVQGRLEQVDAVGWLTAQLARVIALGLSAVFAVPARSEGAVLVLGAERLPVTPNCLGLGAVTVYLAASLAVGADWRVRWRGVRRDVPLLVLANAVRLGVLLTIGAFSTAAVHVFHVVILVAMVPLFLTALWGFWLARDVGTLPRYPWNLAGLTALAFVPALAVWWVVLGPYVATLTAVTTALLTVLGTPIDSVTTVADGLKRFLDLTLPEGGLRLEIAARSLSVVPYLALVAASPLPWARRAWLGLLGTVVLLGLHAAEAATLITLGRAVPALVPAAERLSDVLTLLSGPVVWILLARPGPSWWALVRRAGRTRPAS